MPIVQDIETQLFKLQDLKFREFHSKLIPTVNPETVIGVRTPALRKLAKEISKRSDLGEFLSQLPHRYYEENQLHAFVLSDLKDFDKCMESVNRFLPYVDNWATCDQLSPKIFAKTAENKKRLLGQINTWIHDNEHVYAVRFAIGMLMTFFLDEDFNPKYLQLVSKIRSDEYYINMMIAWYFATALAKQYNATLPFLKKQTLDDWTHNKTIQKARESFRITNDQKAYLQTLKV